MRIALYTLIDRKTNYQVDANPVKYLMSGPFYGSLATSASVFVATLTALLINNYVEIESQRVLSDIVVSFSYEPNLPDTWYQEARQPSPSRRTLLEEVNAAMYAGFTS